jgi:hypothetical protein
MVVARGMTTSSPAIRSFFKSCCNRAPTGWSGRELVESKERRPQT